MTAVADSVAAQAVRIPTDRPGRLVPLRVSAKTDYALRAVAELAATDGTALVKAEAISQAQDIPLRFLLNILNELRHARIVRSHRGADGGYRLGRPAEEITVADVVIAVEGSLTTVHGAYPDEVVYPGPATSLADVWRAVESAISRVLTRITVAELVAGAAVAPRGDAGRSSPEATAASRPDS